MTLFSFVICCLFFKNLSKKHAIIEVDLKNQTCTICDAESANKTKRNNLLLKPNVHYELKENDSICFGNLSFTFVKVS